MQDPPFCPFRKGPRYRCRIGFKEFGVGGRHRSPSGVPRARVSSETAYWSQPGTSSIVTESCDTICFSGAVFSLQESVLARAKPHRLKAALLGPFIALRAVPGPIECRAF